MSSGNPRRCAKSVKNALNKCVKKIGSTRKKLQRKRTACKVAIRSVARFC